MFEYIILEQLVVETGLVFNVLSIRIQKYNTDYYEK